MRNTSRQWCRRCWKREVMSLLDQVDGSVLGFLQPSLASLALAIRLPELARLDVETGQPAVAVDPGVDANGMSPVARQPAALLGVAAHHHLAGLVRPNVVERLPVQQVERLLLQR